MKFLKHQIKIPKSDIVFTLKIRSIARNLPFQLRTVSTYPDPIILAGTWMVDIKE